MSGTILMSRTILTNEVHNQRLFWNFDTLRDYNGYSLHIQGPKMNITPILFGSWEWQFSKVLERWREISTKQLWKKSFTVTI